MVKKTDAPPEVSPRPEQKNPVLEDKEQKFRQDFNSADSRKNLLMICSVLGFTVLFLLLGLYVFYPGSEPGSFPPSVRSEFPEMNRGVLLFPEDPAVGSSVNIPYSTGFAAAEQFAENPLTARAGAIVKVRSRDKERIKDSLIDGTNTSNTANIIIAKAPRKPVPKAKPARSVRMARVKKSPRPPSAEESSRTASLPGEKKYRVLYWIQVASFTSLSRAEDLQKRLQEDGLAGIIQTKSLNGVLHYRVRVGSFKERGQAKQLIAQLEEKTSLRDSRIVQTAVLASF